MKTSEMHACKNVNSHVITCFHDNPTKILGRELGPGGVSLTNALGENMHSRY